MVVEKLEELRQIIAVSKQLGVEPLIGMRARLMSKGGGRWAESGGGKGECGVRTGGTRGGGGMVKNGKLFPCFKFVDFLTCLHVPELSVVELGGRGAARL